MASKIRLKGRTLLIGAVPVFCLTLAVCILLIFSLSLMPLAYRSGALPYVDAYAYEYSKYISLIFSLVVVFVTMMSYTAIRTGTDRYMLKKAQGVHADTKDIFFYFAPRKFFSLFMLSFRLFIIRLILFLFCNIPTAICTLLLFTLGRSTFSAAVSAVIAAGCLAFLISSVYYYSRLSSSLFLIRYYYIKGEYLNFRHLLSSSQNAMRSNTKALCRLKLSFAGWLMLCVLVFPIGYVWSYYKQTLAAWANEIMKLQ